MARRRLDWERCHLRVRRLFRPTLLLVGSGISIVTLSALLLVELEEGEEEEEEVGISPLGCLSGNR